MNTPTQTMDAHRRLMRMGNRDYLDTLSRQKLDCGLDALQSDMNASDDDKGDVLAVNERPDRFEME